MGTSFTIEPITADAKKRLRSAGSAVPARLPSSRGPTAEELRRALAALQGMKVEFSPDEPAVGDEWYINIRAGRRPKSGPFASIIIRQFPGAGKPLSHLYVERGSVDVVAALAIETARAAGPQVVDGEDVYGIHLADGERSPDELAAAMETHGGAELGEELEG